MTESETTPVWKKIYHVISGGNTTVTGDTVEDILYLCKDKIVKGFLEYTPYSKKSFQSWKRHSGLKEIIGDDEMCNFLHLLSKELNLDANVAWTVMCNFLMFEYFGKIDELKSIIRYDTNIRCLVDNVWYFYSADRMFLLKSLRHIFEFATDEEYKFYKQFDSFVKSIDTKNLWNNFKKICENLINEIDQDTAQTVSDEVLKRWIHRNNREQVEVITLLVHIIQFCKVDGSELEDMLVLFIRHGFARHLIYQRANIISRRKDLWEIKCAEIGCVLAIMDQYWRNPGTAKMLSKNLEKNLELLQIQGDNSIVLFGWAVLKTSISSTDNAMEYCNDVIIELIKKRVFRSLHELMTAKIFDGCRSGDIVIEGVFKLMAELIKICADYTYLHEQEGVCYVTAELLKRKGLVVLDYLGPIFQLSMDAFPFVFNPFLEMCKSMLAIPDQHDKIMQLLQHIPSFLAEIPWKEPRESIVLEKAQQLFIDSDLFIIPAGTRVERFQYQGTEFAKFIYPFSFFTLLEQFTKSLSVITFEVGTSWYCYDNLTELVKIGYKFIIQVLKYYKGDFKSDLVLKRLVQRLEIVPAQFCDGPTKNFNFIRLFFETNVTLILYNLCDFSEVFNPIVRKKFFPHVPNFNKTNKELLNQMHFESILFRSLKEEESMQTHSLLIEYLKLIDYMVEKDIYHQELQLAGVWYILNIVFPLHLQWTYEDEYETMLICKLCIKIFVKVLQKPEVSDVNRCNDIFIMCRDAFMFDEVLMTAYLSVFYKDKFYIQSLMEQESNWIKGPILEQMDNIRSQMVLLLLIYRIRTGVPATRKCAIDNKINIVTKAISAHMINPYNAMLRMLGYRFLEIIARDENIPMLALLGLDYDQVQRLFLDKLRDPMEDDNVKMQILNLISTCINYQHGMTAALFNITRSRKWHSDFKDKPSEGDTVTDFMIDYLQNIKKSHEYLKNPLQIGILKVIANLWLSRKRHLVKDIINLNAFWPLLADPLFQKFNHSPSVYGHIFKILSAQLGDSSGDRKHFIAMVEKFLTDEKIMEQWQKYMMKTLSYPKFKSSDKDEKQFLVQSWLEFMLMVEKEEGLKKISSKKIKFLFIKMCLDGVHFNLINNHCLDTWMNMCLLFITQWGLHFKHKQDVIVKKIIQMFATIKLHYTGRNLQSRSTILTIILNVLTNLNQYFEDHTDDLLDLLAEIGFIFDYEYKEYTDEIWAKVSEGGIAMRELMIPWMMCTYISNKLLKMKNINHCSLWFSYRSYLQNLMKCICNLISKPQTFPLCKIALHSLQLYVESPLAFDFLNVNMTSFYDVIESPLTAILANKNVKNHPEELDECWVTCSFLMKFNQAFLKKFQYTALSTCYTYIKLHEQILNQIMLIPETTVTLKALDLLINTLTFFDAILVYWQKEWYRKSNQTYTFILSRVTKVVNSCLYIILRPKNILLYKQDDNHKLILIDKVPMSLTVVIMDRLISISYLSFSMLYRANPNLNELIGVTIEDSATVLIQNDFSVPKFELPIPYDLTYGKLLCLAHFLCKTLDALSCKTSHREEDVKKYYNRCIGVVEHQDSAHNFPNQKLGSYLRYAMYEYSGLADPWIHKLDQKQVKRCFELLMTFLAQQVFLFVWTMDSETLPYFKRNLASELQFFYEHVKKHISTSFSDQVTTSVRTASIYKTDVDVIKNFLISSRTNNKYLEIADSNFGVAIVHWFIKICQIS